MIDAEIYTQSDGKIIGFVLRGHSERGDARGHGYNVRCAEASALSSAAYLGIRQYLNRDAAAENNEHGGLGVELKDAPDDLTEAVFRTMLIGLRKMEKRSPDVIKVSTIETDTETEANLQSKLNRMKPTPAKPLPPLPVKQVRIRAEIFRDDNGNVTGFSINERKSKPVDEFKIYCASIWALTRAAAACVKDYLKRDVTFKADSRRLAINLKAAPDDVTEAVFQTALIGLREIEKQAPQIVQVNEKFPFGGEHK